MTAMHCNTPHRLIDRIIIFIQELELDRGTVGASPIVTSVGFYQCYRKNICMGNTCPHVRIPVHTC